MKRKSGIARKTGLIAGIIVCVILIPILIVNITMIIKSYTSPGKVPDFMGFKPFIVLSGSMEPTIMTGDIVITKSVDAEDIRDDDIIAYRSEDDIVVTHRVLSIEEQDGGLVFFTKGDNNNNADPSPVPASELEGRYILRVGGMGNFAMFLQTPIGLLVFVITPLLLFILWDMFTRNRKGKSKSKREEELLAELEQLRASQKPNTDESDSGKPMEAEAAVAAKTAENVAVDTTEEQKPKNSEGSDSVRN